MYAKQPTFYFTVIRVTCFLLLQILPEGSRTTYLYYDLPNLYFMLMAKDFESFQSGAFIWIMPQDQQQQSPVQLALAKAVQGGTSGAMAMGIQVSTLMWMRTTMNYQYRYGTTTTQALK